MTFLNHGSFGATPRAVLEARHALEQELEAQPVRFMLGVEDRLRDVIARLAPHLGAEPAGLVFVDNATTGVNAVLASLGLRPGDRILVTDHGYEGVRHAVDHLCERTGARKVVVRVPFPVTDADEVVEALARGLDRHRPRLCIVDHLTSITAVVMPVGRIVRACHAREVPVLVDGAHVPGQLPVDLRALGADFWVGNLHKWMLAPKGTAVLHVAERWRDRVQPTVISLGHGRDLHARFAWPGTRDHCGWLATDAVLDLLEALGADRVRAWGIRQREEAATVLAEAWDAPPTAPPELQAAMATVRLPFDAGGDWEAGKRLGRQLWERHRVETMFPPFAGRTWARISLPLYAELDDVRRLVEVLGPEGVA